MTCHDQKTLFEGNACCNSLPIGLSIGLPLVIASIKGCRIGKRSGNSLIEKAQLDRNANVLIGVMAMRPKPPFLIGKTI